MAHFTRVGMELPGIVAQVLRGEGSRERNSYYQYYEKEEHDRAKTERDSKTVKIGEKDTLREI